MKRHWLLAVIAANLVVLLALVFVYPHLMVAPGALMPEHAGLATDCFACHVPLRGVSAARCETCHALSDIGLRTTKGVAIADATGKPPFHQHLLEGDCMACHSDHAGPRLTKGSRKPFSHALLREPNREQCEACHKAPAGGIHARLTTGCAQCHQASAWTPTSFNHARFFVLEDEHDTRCVTCHVGGDVRRYTCFGCHEHTPENVRRKHRKEGISDFEQCADCHRSAQGEPHKRR